MFGEELGEACPWTKDQIVSGGRGTLRVSVGEPAPASPPGPSEANLYYSPTRFLGDCCDEIRFVQIVSGYTYWDVPRLLSGALMGAAQKFRSGIPIAKDVMALHGLSEVLGPPVHREAWEVDGRNR